MMDFSENPYHIPSHEMGDFAKDLSSYINPSATAKNYASEVTITVKDEEKTQKTKHLVYESYTVNEDDPVIKGLVAKALQEFNSDPTDIKIRINLEVL